MQQWPPASMLPLLLTACCPSCWLPHPRLLPSVTLLLASVLTASFDYNERQMSWTEVYEIGIFFWGYIQASFVCQHAANSSTTKGIKVFWQHIEYWFRWSVKAQLHYGTVVYLLCLVPPVSTCSLAFCDAFISTSPSSTFCVSVCSPAVVPPCSPPSVWIVFLPLLLILTAIKTSALLHSFPSALRTLILHVPAPPLTYPVIHSTL